MQRMPTSMFALVADGIDQVATTIEATQSNTYIAHRTKNPEKYNGDLLKLSIAHKISDKELM